MDLEDPLFALDMMKNSFLNRCTSLAIRIYPEKYITKSAVVTYFMGCLIKEVS